MAAVDENSRVALEIVSQGANLSEQLLLKIMKKIVSLLSKDTKERDKALLKNDTIEGKQKINDLIRKHKEGVLALNENITKQQLNDYKKELKRYGVDFSVVKNGKDSFSFFFAGQQANVIEKALKNVAEGKSRVLENEQVKNLEVDLDKLKEELPKEKVLEVKELYDKTSTTPEEKEDKNPVKKEITTPEKKEDKSPVKKEKKINTVSFEKLSSREKLLFSKLKELDDIKRSLYVEEIKRVENLFENRYKKNVDVEKGNENKVTEFKDEKDQVKHMLNSLNNDEQKLMIQYINVMTENLDNHFADKSSYVQSKKLVEMKKNFTPEQIEKVTAVVDQNVYSASNPNEKENGKIHFDDFHSILKDIRKEQFQEKAKENKVEFSMNGVKAIDKKIKEESKEQDKDRNRKELIER